MSKSVPIKAAKQTITIVEAIGHADGISLSELADEVDMPRSTVHDYVQTLMMLNYLTHHDDGYRLGTKFLELGTRRRLQMSIYETAEPELNRLAEQTEEHATLTIEEHGMGVLLSTVMGANAVEVVAHDGTRTYLHTTAPGKAILAHMPEDRTIQIIDRYGDDPLPSFASETITNREELFEELERVRERGYAFDMNEALDGMYGVGAPILDRDDDGVVGAISVYAPSNRMTTTDLEDKIPELLLQAANVIELNLAARRRR